MAYLGTSSDSFAGGVPPALGTLDLATQQDDHLAPSDLFTGLIAVQSGNPQPTIDGEQGRVSPGFGGDFFGRVHLVRSRQFTGNETIQQLIQDWESSLDLGNIIQAESFPFLVLNLDRSTSRDVTGITIVNPLGVSATPNSFPVTLNPFDHQEFTVDVALDGPPALDSQVRFEVESQSALLLDLIGRRVVMFSHRPQVPMTEELQFKTDVMVARDGREQRVAARVSPRVLMAMEYLLAGPERMRAINATFGWGSRTFGVPAWHEAQPLSADISAGATSLPVDTRFADFRDVGDSNLGVLWRAHNDFEVFRILLRNDSQLDLKDPLAESHPAGTLVIPVRLAHLGDFTTAPRHRVGPQVFRVQWHAVDGLDVARLEAATPFADQTYLGDPVMLDFNFVTGLLDEEIVQDYERFDPDGGGPFTIIGHRDAPANVTRKTWFVSSDEDLFALRAMLQQLQGRRSAFWIPTFGKDFELTQPLTSSGMGFEATTTDYARFIAQQMPRAHVIVFKRDGSAPILREIIASQDTGTGVEDFTVDSSWDENVPLSNIERVSLLLRARLDSDQPSFEHDHNESRLEVPLREVIQ